MKGQITAVYTPGLASRGGTKLIVMKALKQAEKTGIDINLSTYEYPSHQNSSLTDFDRDRPGLERHIKQLVEQGTPKESIGLIGACYGSYIATPLVEKDKYAFAIFAEPYFGKRSLNLFYRLLTETLERTPSGFVPKIRIRRKNQDPWRLDIPAFARFLKEDVTPNEVKTPTLALITNAHHFFNKPKIRKQLEQAGVECREIDLKKPKAEYEQQISEEIARFLVNQVGK